MKLAKYKENCAKVILENYNGRYVVCYGDIDKEFANYLNANGIEIAFQVLRTKGLCDEIKNKYAGILENAAGEFYVISTSSSNSAKDIEWIIKYGYEERKDFLFMGVQPTSVTANSINWYDKNGNTCSYCPENCKIIFTGHNSEVVIPTDIKIKKHFSIRVGEECKVIIGEKAFINNGDWILTGDYACIELGDNASLNETNFILHSNSKISVGSRTTVIEMFGRTFPGNDITIGKDCLFAQRIVLFAGDGHAIFDTQTRQRRNSPDIDGQEEGKYSIKLGDHVWIGMSAKLLNGTHVGSGSIIGIGAVVKGKFPNNCSIAGNPAKVIRKDIAWSRNIMDMGISACGEEYCGLTEDKEKNQ